MVESVASRGAALFSGAEPLTGMIRGHQSTLPAGALSCVNCHGQSARSSSAGSRAPLLSAAFLLRSLQRRGGPPTAYDEVSFCRVLREGVDPAYILVAREMPVYELDEAQCAGLWEFLSGQLERTGARS